MSSSVPFFVLAQIHVTFLCHVSSHFSAMFPFFPTGSPKNTQNSVAIKPDPDSSDLVSKPLASSTTSATTNASTSLVTCLDCGDKCADFSRLREHKKWACPKTHGDMSRTALLARPIRCLNCHDASFHSYLDLHKHQVGVPSGKSDFRLRFVSRGLENTRFRKYFHSL